jgi:transmembrane sensor
LQAEAAWLSLDKAHDGVAAIDHGRQRFSRRTVLGTASALAATLIGALFWRRSGTVYRTELGEIRHVPLADGSSATINSDSEVKVRLADNRREVRLASGEAWFRVMKDPMRPFVVEAGQVVVQAVGTAFSVRRRENGADVLVTEGVVETWAVQADGHRIRLVAGQSAFVGDNAEVRMAAATPSSVDRTLAWRSGTIDLSGERVVDAIEEFNRYNRRKLVLEDPRLASEQFDGSFRTDDPEGFANAVGRSFGVAIDRNDPNVIRIGGPS